MPARETGIFIRSIRLSDAAAWQAMRSRLWPEGADDHAAEIASFWQRTSKEPAAVLVATDDAGLLTGFVELSIRVDIPGLTGKRVGYVEGLYVEPEARGSAVAWALLNASRKWASEQGCEACASDRADRLIFDSRFGRAGGSPRPKASFI